VRGGGGRDLHSSTIRLDLSAFMGYVAIQWVFVGVSVQNASGSVDECKPITLNPDS